MRFSFEKDFYLDDCIPKSVNVETSKDYPSSVCDRFCVCVRMCHKR